MIESSRISGQWSIAVNSSKQEVESLARIIHSSIYINSGNDGFLAGNLGVFQGIVTEKLDSGEYNISLSIPKESPILRSWKFPAASKGISASFDSLNNLLNRMFIGRSVIGLQKDCPYRSALALISQGKKVRRDSKTLSFMRILKAAS